MSVAVLNDKIRKTKNPSVILFEADFSLLPPDLIQQEGAQLAAYRRFCTELLEGLKGLVPAVRFSFASFALLGVEGIQALSACLQAACERGYYVMLDFPEVTTPSACKLSVDALLGNASLACDAVVVGSYLGSDVIQPMKQLCKAGKAVFCVVRTSNKSAVELQDLLTGGRLVHTAAADVVWRHGEPLVSKCGYSQLGIVAAAGSANSLRTLRSKYGRLFMLLDGYDYPSANAKNCSFAFDQFGHGAVVCAAASITGAWKDEPEGEKDFVAHAVAAAERMKKNLTRYINIL